MQQIEHRDQLTEPADHLALDEALLLEAEAGDIGETIRVWEFAEPPLSWVDRRESTTRSIERSAISEEFRFFGAAAAARRSSAARDV